MNPEISQSQKDNAKHAIKQLTESLKDMNPDASEKDGVLHNFTKGSGLTRQQRRQLEFRKAKDFAKSLKDPTRPKKGKLPRKSRRALSFKAGKKELGQKRIQRLQQEV